MKKRIEYLDFLKGLAMILVVIGHLVSQLYTTEPEVYEHNVIFKFCYSFHMPLFVFISGWVAGLTVKSDVKWLTKRLRSIGIPFIAAFVIWCGILHRTTFHDSVYRTPFWYLPFILIADSLLFIDRKAGTGNILLIAFIPAAFAAELLIADQLNVNGHPVHMLTLIENFFIFYILGVNAPAIRKKLPKLTFAAAVVSPFLYAAAFPFYEHGVDNQVERVRGFSGFDIDKIPFCSGIIAAANKYIMPLFGIGSVMLITWLVYRMPYTKLVRTAFQFIGKHTLFIYLLHVEFFFSPTGHTVPDCIISGILAVIFPAAISCLWTLSKRRIVSAAQHH